MNAVLPGTTMGRTQIYPLLFTTLCTIALTFCSCTDEPPVTPPLPGEGDTLAVTVQDVSPTSVTLQLTVNSTGEYRLDRDGTTAWSGSITPPDTVIVDGNLLPSTEYQYTLMHIVDGSPVSNSPATTVRTSDTSSHEFVWEVDTLFWPGTSQPAFFTARAMYAISATNVYMVGYSTGHDICWHWDGEEWSSINVGDYLAGEIIDIDGIDSSYIVMAGRDYGGTNYASMGVFNNGNFETLPIPLGDKLRTCLHVAARDEIYLGSVQGVQRYNGTEWEWLLDSTETVAFEFYPKYIHKFPDGTLEMVSQRNLASLGNNVTRWEWKNERFVPIDSFALDEKDYSKVRFGFSISNNEDEVFSTGFGGTFARRGNSWDKLYEFGGSFVTGERDNLFVVRGWDFVWHFNGNTLKNHWSEIQQVAPGLRRIYETQYIDKILFVCAELDPTSRDVVILRGRQVQR